MALPSQLGPAASLASKLFGFGAGKTWQDRVKEAAYTSPVTGTRVTFDYEDVNRSFDIRGTVFNFPDVNNSYVQQTGYGARTYPLTCYFSGKNCDVLASNFEAVLLEPGTGRLEHPLYGTFDVVPFGTVERNDALATAANQSVVTVTFLTTIGAIYPSSQKSAVNEIEAQLSLFAAANAGQFANIMKLGTALRKASAIGTIRGLLKTVKGALAKVSASVSSIRNTFASAVAAINEGMDVLIGAPLLLAQQINNLILAPGRALAGLASRLDAYARLAQSIFGSSAGSPAKALSSASTLVDNQAKVANDFHAAALFAMSAVAGSVTSVIAQPITTALAATGVPNFTSRTQVLSAAASVLAQMDALVEWREAGFQALAAADVEDVSQAIDTGEAYVALQQLVALTAGYLIQASFSALPERSLVLDRERTIIDLCAELYGNVDESLDLLISTNNFTGDELLEVPRGRRVVYYPS